MEVTEAMQLTSSSVASRNHARIFQLQELEKAWQESEADLLAKYSDSSMKRNLPSYSLKMSQQLDYEEQKQFPKNFPKEGMIVDGVCYPLVMWERSIKGKGGSYWATPNTMEHLPPKSYERSLTRGKTDTRPRRRPGNLREQVAYEHLMPTPTVNEVLHKNMEIKDGRRLCKNGNTHSIGLTDYVKMIPTPSASDSQRGAGKVYNPHSKSQGDRTLVTYAKRTQLPTPQARDYINKGRPSEMNRHSPSLASISIQNSGKKLCPKFVALLMGYPTMWLKLSASVIAWYHSK